MHHHRGTHYRPGYETSNVIYAFIEAFIPVDIINYQRCTVTSNPAGNTGLRTQPYLSQSLSCLTFSNFEGGSTASDDFNADAYLGGLEKLAKLGVTWVSVHLPGDSLTHVLETLDRFRTLVIDAM